MVFTPTMFTVLFLFSMPTLSTLFIYLTYCSLIYILFIPLLLCIFYLLLFLSFYSIVDFWLFTTINYSTLIYFLIYCWKSTYCSLIFHNVVVPLPLYFLLSATPLKTCKLNLSFSKFFLKSGVKIKIVLTGFYPMNTIFFYTA